MWRKGNPCALLVGLQTGAATVESSMEIPQKLKMKLPYELVVLLLGIYLKKSRTLIQKNVSISTFIAALFTVAKIWKQPRCPSVGEWIKQLRVIYTMEYYSAVKKKILLFVIVWMDLESIMLNGISQSEKDKCRVISFIRGI